MYGSFKVSDTEFIILSILFVIIVIAAFLFFRKDDSDLRFKSAGMRMFEKGFWKSIKDVDRNKD
jgi:hypothetical protein